MKMSRIGRCSLLFSTENYTCCRIQSSAWNFIHNFSFISGIWDRMWRRSGNIWALFGGMKPRKRVLDYKKRFKKKSRSKWKHFYGFSQPVFLLQWKFYEWILYLASTRIFHLSSPSIQRFLFDALFHLFYYEVNATGGERKKHKKKTDTNVKRILQIH